MADVSKVNVNSTDYNIKDSNSMHKGVDRVTAGQSIIAPIGTASTADGFAVNASGDYSHASGFHTIAASDVQHVIGKYNEEDANGTYPFIIGGGRLDTDRKNIFTVDWNGDVNAGRSNGLTNDTKLPTGADVISYLNSNLAPNLILSTGDITTTDATVFNCNWSSYKYLLIACGNYNNISGTSLVPASYMAVTAASNRVVIYMGSYFTFEVWKSGNNAVTVKIGGTGAETNHLRVRIYGIIPA